MANDKFKFSSGVYHIEEPMNTYPSITLTRGIPTNIIITYLLLVYGHC